MPTSTIPWTWNLPYPARSVLARWPGLLAMMLGVGIALGVGMMMLGVSKASAELLTRDYEESSADIYVLQSGGKLIPLLPGEGPGVMHEARHTLGLVRATPGVRSAVGLLSWSLERERPGRRGGDEPKELMAVTGVDGNPTAIPGAVLLTAGRWLNRADEIVVGARVSRQLGLGIGDVVRLSGRDFRVVGIGRLRGMGLSASSLAYMDLQSLRRRADVGDTLQLIVVDTSNPALVRERLEQLDGYRVADLAGARAEADVALATDRAIHGIFIGLTLAIAALFVASVLNRSVARRRIDFATLRAIGIRRRTILGIVAAEAMLVSLVAGVIGIGISTALGALINGVYAPAFGIEILYVVDSQLFGAVFLMAIGLGVLAGLVPARRATQVDPVEVLREA